MRIEFKIAAKNDLPGIIELCNKCFDEETPIKYARRIFNQTKHDKNQIYIIGVVDKKIIAHAKVTIIPTIYKEMNTYAILNHICVDPEYRRMHIGPELLDVCFMVAKKHKCKTVELWSKNFRVAAHALYKNYGFSVMDAKFFEKEVK